MSIGSAGGGGAIVDKIFAAGSGRRGAGFFGSPALAPAYGRFFRRMAPHGAENGGRACDFGRFGARFRQDFDDLGRPGGAPGINAMCILLC